MTGSTKRGSLAGLLLALLLPLPLTAADIYIPLAANLSLGAARYRTLLVVTNAGSQSASFAVRFLANGTDGNQGPAGSAFGLAGGATVRLYELVPDGARGMFALSGTSGAAGIVASARLEALGASGNVLASTELPVFSAKTWIAAGEHAQLVSLEQSAQGAASDFGLANFGNVKANCTVVAFRADGSAIADPVNLFPAAQSSADFSAALPRLGENAIKDARFDVTCDQPFATYSLTYRSGGPETVLVAPATRLDGTLAAIPVAPPPAPQPPPPPPPPADGHLRFNLPGEFANGSTYAAYDLPLKDGVRYVRAHIELDIFLNRFHPADPGNPNFETVASFRRSASRRDERVLYWGLIIKGSGDFRTLLDLGLAPGASEGTLVKSNGGGPWDERSNYHLTIDYDTAAQSTVFKVFQDGQLIERLDGPANNLDISNVDEKLVRVDFSAPSVGDGAYFPTDGWRYSNLAVELTPRP